MKTYLSELELSEPATETEIRAAEHDLDLELPDQYKEFLRHSNGADGGIGDVAYIILWRVNDLASFNENYEVKTYVPGLVLFGSNGGGEGYGFDTRSPEKRIVKVPFVPMEWDLAIDMGETFVDFLKALSEATE